MTDICVESGLCAYRRQWRWRFGTRFWSTQKKSIPVTRGGHGRTENGRCRGRYKTLTLGWYPLTTRLFFFLVDLLFTMTAIHRHDGSIITEAQFEQRLRQVDKETICRRHILAAEAIGMSKLIDKAARRVQFVWDVESFCAGKAPLCAEIQENIASTNARMTDLDYKLKKLSVATRGESRSTKKKVESQCYKITKEIATLDVTITTRQRGRLAHNRARHTRTPRHVTTATRQRGRPVRNRGGTACRASHAKTSSPVDW